MHTVRPFKDSDRAALVAIGNRDRPEHRHNAVASWEFWDAKKSKDQVEIRLIVTDADDQPIASLHCTDLNTTDWKMADVCDMDILVDHKHRCQGLGAMLYDKAMTFAGERGAKRVTTGFRETQGADTPAVKFLTARGFAEQEREKPSYLDLQTWDATPFLPYLQKAEAAGARLFTYADVKDNEENQRKLYNIFVPIIYDIPRRDDQPFTIEPFEKFIEMKDHPKWTPELLQLAALGDEWVGMTHLMPTFDRPDVSQWITGVTKEARDKGIATAMKVKNYMKAQERGFRVITTENHEDNGPMLAVNVKFGFQPEPHMVLWNKPL